MSDLPRTPSERELATFYAALEKSDPAERSAFLDEACSGDRELRRWIEQEIRRQTSRTYLERTVIAGSEADADSSVSPEVKAILAALKPEEPGEQIGPYTLIQRLGEGGFGTVWMAEQQKPVRRDVALKILKPGMDSRQIIGRFEQERQALAMLDHPGIAKVFDAGATPTLRPYFAMELVRGEPITDHCDLERLSIRARLELLMRVCYAVQHAHQKGIIHRDLKPSNILVARLDDGSAAPKVIDLGLAKATIQVSTEHTAVVTQAERMLGTPLYMSPEQAEGSPDLDTRTDIYSLGAILYELLTGRTPHDPSEISQRSHDQIRSAIRQQEPQLPSAALRKLPPADLERIAKLRGTDSKSLIRLVRGELDFICMKALEKDRRRRYSSATTLAADIQAHLLNEPISARPPSKWYRARKFTQRHRRPLLAFATVVLTVFLAAGISIREALRAKAAEQDAIDAQGNEARERARAEREMAAARLNEYVADLSLAQQSLSSGNLGRAVQLLEKHRPQPGQADHRGWGWRYLWNLAQGDQHIDFPNHKGPADNIAVSLAGELFAVTGLQGTTVYNAQTLQIVATVGNGAEAFAFLPDGKLAISFSRGRIQLWSTDDWSEQGAWQEGGNAFAISPDGQKIAVESPAGVRLRSTADWQVTRILPGVHGPLAFSADGNLLAASRGNAGMQLYNLSTDKTPVAISDTAAAVPDGAPSLFRPSQPMGFAQGGKTLVAVDNTPSEKGVFVLRLWSTADGAEEAVMPDDPERPEHNGAITAVAVSPDGNTVATASLDHSVRIWDLAKKRRTAVLQGHRAEVGACAFSPDGRFLYTCDRSGDVKAWELGREKAQDVVTDASRVLGFSSDGRVLAVLNGRDAVSLVDAHSNEPLRTFPLEASERARPPVIAVTSGLGLLVEALSGGQVRVTDLKTGENKVLATSASTIDFLSITPDARTLIYAARGGAVFIRNLADGSERQLPFSGARMLVSPRGRYLAIITGGTQGGRKSAGTPGRERSGQPEGRMRPPRMPRFPGMTFPPTPQGDLSVVIWDLVDSKVYATLAVEEGIPVDAAFSPDDRLFATACTDNALRLWDMKTGEQIGMLTGHKQVVRGVAFSYDGQSIASTSEDSTLRVWNIASQQELLSFQRLGYGMGSLTFSPDDSALAVEETGLRGARVVRFFRAPSLQQIASIEASQNSQ